LEKNEIADEVFFIENFEKEIEFFGKKLSWKMNFAAENLPKNQAIFDEKKLIFPLKIRRWLRGDRFFPAGMAGKSKKLSDFFVDSKMAISEKEKTWILENGDGQIIWILGLRADERFVKKSGILAEFN
jgi:tRNA(Ile)-lysidine synthase